MNKPDYDPEKADVFSVGICILSLVSKIDFRHFYDFESYSVMFKKIKMELGTCEK